MKKRRKGFVILYTLAIIVYIIVIVFTFFSLRNDKNRKAESNANLLMNNFMLLQEKMNFVAMVASGTNWVQKMSILDTESFENTFPLDIYDAQAVVQTYNALMGFSCETFVLFDKSSYAVSGSGKISFANLSEYFDAGKQEFSIYNKQTNVCGNIRFVRFGGVVNTTVYSFSNSVNEFDFRIIFVVQDDYFKNSIGEIIDIDHISISYGNEQIFKGKKFVKNHAVQLKSGHFTFEYSSAYPLFKLFVYYIISSIVVFIIFEFIYGKLDVYYNSINRCIHRLNDLMGDKNGFSGLDGTIKEFEEILSDVALADLQSKVCVSNDFNKLIEEYLRNIAKSGEKIAEDVKLGLSRFGVEVEQIFYVVYNGGKEQMMNATFNLGDAFVFINAQIDDVTEVYGKSSVYCGLEKVAKAYEEAKTAYEIAVLYSKKHVNYSDIKIEKTLPCEVVSYLDNLDSALVSADQGSFIMKTKDTSERLLRDYVDPIKIKTFFIELGEHLTKFEEELYIKTDVNMHSLIGISEVFDLVVSRVGVLFERINMKGSNRYSYYCTIIKDYVSRNYANPELSLTMVADEFNFSPAYISRIFTESGELYTDYVNNLRISHAKKLLKETDLSVSSIAKKVGIIDDVTFRRVFKKYIKMLPSEYRNSVNND